jgi:hypothetical protein
MLKAKSRKPDLLILILNFESDPVWPTQPLRAGEYFRPAIEKYATGGSTPET